MAYERFVKWQKEQRVDKDFLYRYKQAVADCIIEPSDPAFAVAIHFLDQHPSLNQDSRRKSKQQTRAQAAARTLEKAPTRAAATVTSRGAANKVVTKKTKKVTDRATQRRKAAASAPVTTNASRYRLPANVRRVTKPELIALFPGPKGYLQYRGGGDEDLTACRQSKEDSYYDVGLPETIDRIAFQRLVY